jgi:phenylacetate-CoA ligase
VKRHPEVAKARLVVSHVDGSDAMQLLCESAASLNVEGVAGTIRDITKLRGDVQSVSPGTLPNDGKVIEDLRSYA